MTLRAAVVALVAIVLGGCGTDSAEPRTLTCPDDEAEIVEAMRSGLPTYDYEPAGDLAELIDRVDVVLVATLDAVVRTAEGPDAATEFRVGEVEILAGEPNDPIVAFGTDSQWVVRGEVDPIGALVTVEGMTVLAAIEAHPPSPGGHRADVQGIHVTCDATAGVSTNVIAPAPGNQNLRPLADVVEAIRALVGDG